jgi:hypothetical protein
MAEQAKIEAQLGMRDIQVGLEHTHIGEDEQMCVDKAPEPRPIEAKLRALEKFVRVAFPSSSSSPPPPFRPPSFLASGRVSFVLFLYLFILMIRFCQGSAFRQQFGDKVPRLSLEEAVELEQQAHAADRERKQRLLERRQRQGLVAAKDRALTREEQEARIWAFMCDDLADLIMSKSGSDYLPLSGIISHRTLTSKMKTMKTMKTRQRGSTMIRMTGERVRTLLSPMPRIFRT